MRLTVAGNIRSAQGCRDVIKAGADIATIGRAAILHHDFPEQVRADQDFKPRELPVSESYLNKEGLSERFVTYMRRWPGFVE